MPVAYEFFHFFASKLGDKTQHETVALAAKNSALLFVAGLPLMFAVLTSVAVSVGAKLLSYADKVA